MMNRELYPVDPNEVVRVLFERHAYHDEEARICAAPAKLSALMSLLGLGPEHRNKFKQQLQDMQLNLYPAFGVFHGYYPTGWQLSTEGALAYKNRLIAAENAKAATLRKSPESAP